MFTDLRTQQVYCPQRANLSMCCFNVPLFFVCPFCVSISLKFVACTSLCWDIDGDCPKSAPRMQEMQEMLCKRWYLSDAFMKKSLHMFQCSFMFFVCLGKTRDATQRPIDANLAEDLRPEFKSKLFWNVFFVNLVNCFLSEFPWYLLIAPRLFKLPLQISWGAKICRTFKLCVAIDGCNVVEMCYSCEISNKGRPLETRLEDTRTMK